MVNLDKISKNINGYYIIDLPDEENVIQFSPFSGKELKMAFDWELKLQISYSLSKSDRTYEFGLDWSCKFLNTDSPLAFEDIPEKLELLYNDRTWFQKRKMRERQCHIGKCLCGALCAFIDGLYGLDELPLIAKIPIYYCPWCGAKLDSRFKREGWFERNKNNW